MASLAAEAPSMETKLLENDDSLLSYRRLCEVRMRRLERYKKAKSFCNLDDENNYSSCDSTQGCSQQPTRMSMPSSQTPSPIQTPDDGHFTFQDLKSKMYVRICKSASVSNGPHAFLTSATEDNANSGSLSASRTIAQPIRALFAQVASDMTSGRWRSAREVNSSSVSTLATADEPARSADFESPGSTGRKWHRHLPDL
uniref:Uncharacterized protein n=1 Tax=Steinernema glaseri TaxID=37863 RepID=A0A1I8A1V0_9BILA